MRVYRDEKEQALCIQKIVGGLMAQEQGIIWGGLGGRPEKKARTVAKGKALYQPNTCVLLMEDYSNSINA